MGESLASYLRGLQLDNFTMSGDVVSIGRSRWRASQCGCGKPDCDGWALEPIGSGAMAMIDRTGSSIVSAP